MLTRRRVRPCTALKQLLCLLVDLQRPKPLVKSLQLINNINTSSLRPEQKLSERICREHVKTDSAVLTCLYLLAMPIPQRYEPVPQRDDTIFLDTIDVPNYNYNSAIPNSVSAPSIPGSPPPSFHSHQSISSPPGTPRPTIRGGHDDAFAGLWNTNPGSDATAVSTSSDASASLAVALLRGRVDRLEEALGRLLMEKEESKVRNPGDPMDSNCCVVFSGLGSDDEDFVRSSKSNCCVTFSNSRQSARERKEKKVFAMVVLFVVFVFLLLAAIVVLTIVNDGAKAASACLDSCRSRT
ncbi:hypothetical protein PVAG01_05886 [Phlyctema vagabunda]|uniref:Uncharacterized protein n=1 Tax=Phlyctema vagabunda TaxID=108571 RepID=A0ABR4PEN7_9HELO